ncbi:Trm112 family protein [Mesosutterella sp. AGMB02718]|uniref:Trm112 family protein n=1 Tax=Mesosutterella faecium TaxID=2925194 RepID=A0ABT7IKS5_9BURK|nr:Trm112 family protein [Mesosutterella sp. AGMB02718]MDL2058516.1 Trm112 family protein [Mesosutterella sp. AGMB02718]
MDPKITEVLVCPVCKGPLAANKAGELVCTACRLAYSVKDGIPDMIEHNARTVSEEEAEKLRAARAAAPLEPL